MKPADLVTVIFVLVLGGGGAAGFMFWQAERARAIDQAYEQIIDEGIDGKISAGQLTPVVAMLAAHEGDKLEALRALYADQDESDRLNLGFGHLQSDWPATYERIAGLNGRQVDRSRLQAEVEERFGPGSLELMQTQYRAFLADAPRRAAESQERARRENEETARAIDAYMRQHGRLPEGAFRIENGRIVESAN